MLINDISNILRFVQSKKVNAEVPTCALAERLVEAESVTKTNLLVYDFEFNRLFFANEKASSLLGIDKIGTEEHDGSFLESFLHPMSYQFLLHNARLLKPQTESFDGVFYLKSDRKAKYIWVSATAKVMSFTPLGIPKLIYICFVEVEKAMQCYIKLLQCETKEDTQPFALMASLNSREIEMLGLVAAECTSKEIADILSVSQSAVDAARKRLIKKLKVKSVVGLVKAAMALGLSGKGTHRHTQLV
jgi:DNA-binding CsgD family transcriptional regulator